ncbi:hyaluronoglucosaminidase [Kitasatospora sp. NPDC092948]|uniref:hyaluronoglucosaminidase n=1 Tax=Kitasatospora sp. NPDC092948 TaxID=3364088 RepID=UPI00382F86E9
MKRRLFLGGFTAGAVTVAVGGAESASAATSVTVFDGQVNAQSFYGNGQDGQAAFFKTASTANNTTNPANSNAHALVVYQAGTNGGGTAINAVSDNPDTSAMYLTGTEKGRGTLKIAHKGYADGSDQAAAALSIDLQTAGTAAQGIYLTATNGPTTGSLIALRNNPGVDDFIVRANGLTGIGVSRGDMPRAQLHVTQNTSAAAGLLVEGTVRVGDVATAPGGVDSKAGGGSLFAQGGALYWRGSAGTVTKIASA